VTRRQAGRRAAARFSARACRGVGPDATLRAFASVSVGDIERVARLVDEPPPPAVRSAAAGDFSQAELDRLIAEYGAPIARRGGR
jgi:hypothetical protein